MEVSLGGCRFRTDPAEQAGQCAAFLRLPFVLDEPWED